MPHRSSARDLSSPGVADQRESLRRLTDFEAGVARVTAFMLANRIRLPALLTVGGTAFGVFVGIAGAAGFDHDGPSQKIARVERANRQADSALWAELTKQGVRVDRLELGQMSMGRTLDSVDVRTSRMEFTNCVISRTLAPALSAPGCSPVATRRRP